MPKSIREDRIHREIKDYCVQQLSDCACFEFTSVLQALQLQSVAPSIKWHLIRPWIEEDDKVRLLPVVTRFFHQRSRILNPSGFNPNINPEKFLCKGTGKKAAGYISVTKSNSALVLCRLVQQGAIVSGQAVALDRYKSEVERQGLGVGDLSADQKQVERAS